MRSIFFTLGATLAFSTPLLAAESFELSKYTLTDAGLEVVGETVFKPSTPDRPYEICAVLPNKLDSYWSLVVEGLETQAGQSNVRVAVFDTKDYASVDQQRNIFERRCLNGSYDAILLGASSSDGLNDLITTAKEKGLPVIDLVNGVSSPDIQGKALVPFGLMGAAAIGALETNGAHSGSTLLWFPGPKGPEWSGAADAAFQSGANAKGYRILATDYTSPFFREQAVSVKQQLAAHPAPEFLVGTAPTAEAAVADPAAQDKGMKVIAYYFSPKLRQAIRCGDIVAAAFDNPAAQARVAVDLAVKALNGESTDWYVGPKVELITSDTLVDILGPDPSDTDPCG